MNDLHKALDKFEKDGEPSVIWEDHSKWIVRICNRTAISPIKLPKRPNIKPVGTQGSRVFGTMFFDIFYTRIAFDA